MTDSFATPEGFLVPAQPSLASSIRELFAQYEVVHQSKGRIRLRLPRLSDELYGDRLVQQLTAIVGVSQIQINRLAKSVTLYYQEDSNAAALVQMLLAQAHQVILAQHAAVSKGEAPNDLFKFDLSHLPFKFNLEDSPLQYAIDQTPPQFRPLLYRLLLTLLQVSGGAFLVIGIVGVILPLLPGTPFLILSALCFTAAKELSAMEPQ